MNNGRGDQDAVDCLFDADGARHNRSIGIGNSSYLDGTYHESCGRFSACYDDCPDFEPPSAGQILAGRVIALSTSASDGLTPAESFAALAMAAVLVSEPRETVVRAASWGLVKGSVLQRSSLQNSHYTYSDPDTDIETQIESKG